MATATANPHRGTCVECKSRAVLRNVVFEETVKALCPFCIRDLQAAEYGEAPVYTEVW